MTLLFCYVFNVYKHIWHIVTISKPNSQFDGHGIFGKFTIFHELYDFL